jgi:hypothetical protein
VIDPAQTPQAREVVDRLASQVENALVACGRWSSDDDNLFESMRFDFVRQVREALEVAKNAAQSVHPYDDDRTALTLAILGAERILSRIDDVPTEFQDDDMVDFLTRFTPPPPSDDDSEE